MMDEHEAGLVIEGLYALGTKHELPIGPTCHDLLKDIAKYVDLEKAPQNGKIPSLMDLLIQCMRLLAHNGKEAPDAWVYAVLCLMLEVKELLVLYLQDEEMKRSIDG